MDRRTGTCYTGSMKTSLNALAGVRRMGIALLALFFVLAGHAPAPGATPEATAAQSPRQEAAAAPQAAPGQTAPTQPAPAQPTQNGQDDAIVIRNDAPGYNGYAGTWRDPETGDIVTSVIAPRRPQEQTQQQPIYIAPQIDPNWPGNGYGNSGWPSGSNGGWPSGSNGWNNGWQQGGNTGWNPGWNMGGAPSWRPGMQPGQPGMMPPNRPLPGQRPPSQLPPGAGRPPSAMTPPPAGQPGQTVQPGLGPQPDAPGPGGLPLPDMRPPQAGSQPPQPGTLPAAPPAGVQPGNWQGTTPGWRPSGWQPGGWQPGWHSGWQQACAPATAWRPWGPAGTGVKAWTPGQPPHGDWQPLSWSPGPASAAWNPWQQYGPAQRYGAQQYGMMGGMAGGMWSGMRPGPGMGPGMRPRFLGMPQLPPNITRHLGPVVPPLGLRGGPR